MKDRKSQDAEEAPTQSTSTVNATNTTPASTGSASSAIPTPVSDAPPEVDLNAKHYYSTKALRTIRKQQPTLFKATVCSLEQYARLKRRINEGFTCHEQLVADQLYFTARELYARLKRCLFSLPDFRDNVENMHSLSLYMLSIGANKAANKCSRFLAAILMTSGEFCTQLEQQSGVPQTDWKSVSVHLEKMANNTEEKEITLVPDMSLFTGSKLLGIGGFGAVYKVLIGSNSIILKVIPVERFQNSSTVIVGRLVAGVVHNRLLVRQFASFVTVEAYVTAMEYIKGVELKEVYRNIGTIPLKYSVAMIAQLCIALRYLHAKGFIHRDVKPANIMVEPGTRSKLIDFDTSKQCIGKFASKKTLMTYYRRTAKEFRDGETTGTVPYMAPEILMPAEYGRAVDWWSVGITLYQLHTCQFPFKFAPGPRDYSDMRAKIIEAKYEWPDDGSCAPPTPEMVDIVAKFLAKKLKDRLGCGCYNDIESHPFFKDISWSSWESGSMSLPWPDLDQICNDRPDPETVIDPNKQKNFPKPAQLTKAEKAYPLFTLVSTGFSNTIMKMQRNESTTEADLLDPPWEAYRETPDVPYTFKQFCTSPST